MTRFFPTCVFALACATSMMGVCASSRADEKPKHTIKEIMKEHKKGALKDKVLEGTASADEKKKLVELYTELGKSKPPKGSEENWKKLSDALVKAAKEVADGKDSGIDDLKKAVNCGACHSAHKAS